MVKLISSHTDVMALWRNQLLPRLIDLTLGTDDVSAWRKKCLRGIEGVVVEPGFGSGLNLAHMPKAVTRVYAVDPAVIGQKLAAGRISASSFEVEFVGLDGERLPLEDTAVTRAFSPSPCARFPMLAQRSLSSVVSFVLVARFTSWNTEQPPTPTLRSGRTVLRRCKSESPMVAI